MSPIDWSTVQRRLGAYYPGKVDGQAGAMTWIALVGYAAPLAPRGGDAVTLRGRKLADVWDSAGLITAPRIAGFLSNTTHETGDYKSLRENLYYTTATSIRHCWPSRFANDAAAQPFVRQPELLANLVYARPKCGNISPGDGWRYRGGGDIQITFRNNYRAAGDALKLPLEEHPELIEAPAVAVAAGLSFWTQHGLNAFFDAGQPKRARALVNTGNPDSANPIGWDDVQRRHDRLLALFAA